jgi:hypothetical protein
VRGGDGRTAEEPATGREPPGGAAPNGAVPTRRAAGTAAGGAEATRRAATRGPLRGAVSLNSSSRPRHASRGPPSAYRIRSSAARPGGPYRSLDTRTSVRCPTTSRPRRIHARRLNSKRSAAIWASAPVMGAGRFGGSSTSSWTSARRASAANRCSRSPRAAADRPARPPVRGGRSNSSRSTVRSWRSIAAIDNASSKVFGVRTTSHSSATPRAAASTGSRLRARSR